MGPRSEKLVLNSVLNFRRVTPFRRCLLETQVEGKSALQLLSVKKAEIHDRAVVGPEETLHGNRRCLVFLVSSD